MAPKDPSREAHFPSIEKKYGHKMSYWFSIMKDLADEKYPAQIAYLRENHGFSQVHANALVMYSRGSLSAKRFDTPTQFYKSIGKDQAKTMRAIFKAITAKYPKAELVIAWNQPMLKDKERYVFGCSASKNHITIAPWDPKVLKKVAPMLEGYVVNKKTIRVPSDWKVDEKLLIAMVQENLKS